MFIYTHHHGTDYGGDYFSSEQAYEKDSISSTRLSFRTVLVYLYQLYFCQL